MANPLKILYVEKIVTNPGGEIDDFYFIRNLENISHAADFGKFLRKEGHRVDFMEAMEPSVEQIWGNYDVVIIHPETGTKSFMKIKDIHDRYLGTGLVIMTGAPETTDPKCVDLPGGNRMDSDGIVYLLKPFFNEDAMGAIAKAIEQRKP